jgi:hypothetical protein
MIIIPPNREMNCHNRRYIFRNAQTRETEESPPTHLPRPKHCHGEGPSPAQNSPERDGGERGQPGCVRTLGAPVPPVLPLGPTSLWRLHGSVWMQFPAVSIFTSAKPLSLHYKSRPRALFQNTHHLKPLPHYLSCILFHSFSVST